MPSISKKKTLFSESPSQEDSLDTESEEYSYLDNLFGAFRRECQDTYLAIKKEYSKHIKVDNPDAIVPMTKLYGVRITFDRERKLLSLDQTARIPGIGNL